MTGRPPTRAEIADLVARATRAENEHTAAILRSGGMAALERPTIEVPVDVFGVDSMDPADLEGRLVHWLADPPPSPPRWLGLKPRPTKR